MVNYDTIFLFVTATAALAISPGPDNIYVLVQSLTNGRVYGLATVAGLITGCIIHTTLLAFGVSALISQNDNLFLAIKVLGAIYLLFLAYKVYTSDSAIELGTTKAPKKSLKQLFVQGFFMNVLNPKVTIFFLAFFPGFLFSDTLNMVLQFYILGGVFMLVSFVIFAGIAVSSGSIKNRLLNYERSGLVFKWLQVIVFVGIAIFILMP